MSQPFAITYPEDLPISQRRAEILAALRAHQVVVIAGETGSGKTTQLPKMCLEAGLAERGKIGCTQPRRVAALSVARRVAEELRVTWGREVGCKIRFNDETGSETRIKFMTDGILLAEIQSDRWLRVYSCLILDEAHERSLNIDFLLGYLIGLLKRRPDLKLVVTSATIDTQIFSAAFGNAPIIEVSGRLYPVEIRYAPIESHARPGEPVEELDHIEATVRATEDVLIESNDGDVLVFMPTERDIRETCEALEGGLGSGIEVLRVFGRMPTGEQQRIFSPGPRRRVIVATNIAETSLTLPRIRYVIDAGLSRVSRYNPRTRTKRLPVEEISQSSAQQRAGRAGRLQAGTCVRLYSEEDFEKRPRFTQPEIQRANLAEVILRMKAFRLGEIESFPFLQPPPDAAVHAGYRLLHELGALDDENVLTALGRELARLPLDPTLGRMLLQAKREHSLPEMLVIAAGLSIPDPRERPEEKKEAAAAAHRALADPDSDFLSLLNIWRASPDSEGRGSTGALRRFCQANFLSFTRMREWRDIYRQLAETLHTKPGLAEPGASYMAIHRAVLSGLLGHIAQREERNIYKASGNRQVTLFPGSNLYERREKPSKNAARNAADQKSRQPAWLVAGEIVETSQLFARTAAGIDPEWIVELGAHLCQYRHTEPHWSAKAGRVLVLERVLIGGLEITRKLVDFGRIDPPAATELFIRGALVAEEARLPQRFFQENSALRDKIETALTRVRSRKAHDLDEALYQFYAARIWNVSSVHDLNKFVRERLAKEPNFLCATEEDLVGDGDTTYDRALFPDTVSFGPTALPLAYAYSPGEESDGVTVRVPLPVTEQLTSGELQWMVPGLREEQIGVLLRALPKTVRKTLMPLEPKIREIAQSFAPGKGEFLVALAAHLSKLYRVPVKADDWPPASLPAHLQPRVEVVDASKKTVVSGRDLEAIRASVSRTDSTSEAWEKLARKWERAVTNWDFGDLPESILIEEINGAPVYAYPGVEMRDGTVKIRLFRKREDVPRAAPLSIRKLAEAALTKDLAWLKKELATFTRFSPASHKAASKSFHAALQQVSAKPGSASGAVDELPTTAYEHLLAHLLKLEPVLPLNAARFQAMLAKVRAQLPAEVHALAEITKRILAQQQATLAVAKKYAGLERDVERLVPANFLAKTPHDQLQHLPRYLRAIQIRADRAAVSPAKDSEKVKQLAPFDGWEKRVPLERRDTFRWALEEFRVSLFAQELGTSQPVSAKRLQAIESGE